MHSKLFSPYTIKDVTLKNRIVMSPMCMYSSENEDGKVTNFHLVHYGTRAAGQVGLVMIEATAVLPEGRISNKDLGIWDDSLIEGLHTATTFIHDNGAKAAIQLAHAGRKAELETDALAPSAIPFNETMKIPLEMSKEQIKDTALAFQKAALRSKQAGFDVIEIHGAHGYLINEFLSPLSNKRTDEYGDSSENRYRFLREIIESINEVWDGPLFVRISANDYHPDGLTVQDYVQYSKWMKEQGVDLIDCSSGAVVPAHIDVYPGYQVQYAKHIKEHANIATGAVGLITTGAQAEQILNNNEADLIFIGRELLRNPYFPRIAANELGFELQEPYQYKRAPGKINMNK
ncbi:MULTISPECIES: NADPH dehydrogenase NamA [Bacillus cereus group]|uniref:NADPH dehydrogenase NamA n=1 Tax=Bacillus cereus group TaxID=86661 RepID=UPI000BEB7E76|nr:MULTISPECIES: NADPH dehydrogenase NamA [Bacillus cereus group]MBJ7931322.1 NADPH dehydrogenase NamA [Bacillus cereus group sp. N31]PEG13272.1 NADPH dehydrogenase NamA [Bacillus toyonensis]PEK07162.1 NADPH dehydrogenase NamA [Bacillus toyonensis]PEL48773.1 NADPH dehydrogenase NamA [Bacillus toyonensis]PEM22287.1 NADPH dehydrogenase NamA [Bacillus toyonensis]